MVRWAYRPALKDAATIFMLHRFADPTSGVNGHDPASLRECLEWLRQRNVPFVSLRELFERGSQGSSVPSGAVCFTVDDGYYDFTDVALDVFSEYDVPVTVFLPTGFIDGDCWLWWDRVRFMIDRTEVTSLHGPLSSFPTIQLEDGAGRKKSADAIIAAFERMPDGRRRRGIEALSESVGVEVPNRPPARYRPMSWKEVRSAEERGVRFAPHTVEHPVLSNCPEDRLSREIETSWARLQEKVEHPVPVFAYPQGSEWSFGEREERAVQESGMLGAVSAVGGYAPTALPHRSDALRWRVPRFGFPEDRAQFLQVVSGLLRIRRFLSGASGPQAAVTDDSV